MNVEVLFFGKFRELTSTRQEVIAVSEGAQLAALIEQLTEKYGNAFHYQVTHTEWRHILINGRECRLLNGMETHLKEGDMVTFLSPIFGG